MMDIFNILKERRSIRKYSDKPVSHELITKVLAAGQWAPSGLNNQPWRFLVIHDQGQKEKLAGFTKYSCIIKKAPALILVFLDHQATYDRDKDLMAIGACIQNMLLEAYSLGIGTCWLGEILRRKKAVAGYLRIPANLELMAVISLGYSAEEIKKGKRHLLNTMVLGLAKKETSCPTK